jgi:hypothetical protein
MSTPGNTGGTGEGAPDSGPGTGGGNGAPPEGNSGSGTGAAPPEWDAATEWRALADELGITPAQVKERLGHARTWEQRAKDNRQAATKAQTLEQQVEQMRKDAADRDARDLDRSMRSARSDLIAALVDPDGPGLARVDAIAAIEDIDPGRLLNEGEPDETKIAAVAARLAKVAGRPTPDRDQGAGNGEAGNGPVNMSTWLRASSGRGR